MKFLKTATALCALPLLAACASNWDVDGAKMAANDGSAFQKELQSEYSRLAGLERDEGDWADAKLFVGKALAATTGDVEPQMVADRNIPADKVEELAAARNKLTMAYAMGGKVKAPNAAARAQAGYDCWMQEQEENFQPDDIEACKKYFMAGLNDMSGEKAKASDDIIVYFDFNSSMLTDESKGLLVKASMMGRGANAVMVTGHTDTKGNAAYNESLALTRAQAVSDFLKAHGIMGKSIRVGASGESMNAVTTGDEIEEARNRRVVVSFK
ncbi:Outer membrane protein A [Candidatus Terasakiella magnetica]|uniref:Outer membrane protein A n=1 Tax=Candidatus Terasakiella magnetica TaxID=1867952 RepID=A0A1C3RDB6_9PROT|nr:OmpA family protein [Candidatus Terasakiella magnetica]SCA55259.1 Outer membrane protein A [Candidatus Terasakiella magnetica]